MDSPHARGLVTLIGGVAAFLEGHWARAAERLEKAETILREQCTGVTWEVDTAVQFLIRAHVYLGEMGRLAERYPALLKDNLERGDRYAEVNLRTCASWLVHLIEDRPEAAGPTLDEAISRWSHDGFHLQHYWHMSGRANVAMYRGRGLEAFRIMSEARNDLNRSMLLRIQFTRCEVLHFRARCALAALTDEAADRPTLIREIRRAVKGLRREKLPWANALAALTEGGLAAAEGDPYAAETQLARAIAGLEAADMAIYAAAASRRRGELLGRRGLTAIARADAFMTEQRIVDPEKMTRFLAPGW